MKTSRCSLTAGLFIILTAGGCQKGQEELFWKVMDPESMSEKNILQKEKALEAKEAMFTQLMAKLNVEMGKGGPSHAIRVCQDEAPRIAQEVAKEKNVRIGRTSHKLRNPQNLPPLWAKALISQNRSEPAFLTNAKGELAALLPIKLQSQCLFCHGAPEQITPEAKKVLAQRYPNDQATGFKEGGLRGWFWVEVPKLD